VLGMGTVGRPGTFVSLWTKQRLGASILAFGPVACSGIAGAVPCTQRVPRVCIGALDVTGRIWVEFRIPGLRTTLCVDV
jgi:hypothetical protein